jgi:hypothetical protein
MAKNVFTKDNQPAKKGRPVGSKDIKTLLKCEFVLAAKGINPTDEILKLIPQLEPKDQLEAWQFLLKYCQPQYSPTNIMVVSNSNQSEIKSVETEDLLNEVIDVQPS